MVGGHGESACKDDEPKEDVWVTGPDDLEQETTSCSLSHENMPPVVRWRQSPTRKCWSSYTNSEYVLGCPMAHWVKSTSDEITY